MKQLQFWLQNTGCPLAFAAAIAVAFSSQRVAAQTPSSPLEIHYAAGETSKSIPASRQYAAPVYLHITTTPVLICGVQTPDEVKSRIATLIANGQLQTRLNDLENHDLSTVTQTRDALAGFMIGSYGAGSPQYGIGWMGFTTLEVLINSAQYNTVLAGTSLDLKRESCLTEADAKIWILQIRKVVRAYLGMPAPQ